MCCLFTLAQKILSSRISKRMEKVPKIEFFHALGKITKRAKTYSFSPLFDEFPFFCYCPLSLWDFDMTSSPSLQVTVSLSPIPNPNSSSHFPCIVILVRVHNLLCFPCKLLFPFYSYFYLLFRLLIFLISFVLVLWLYLLPLYRLLLYLIQFVKIRAKIHFF